MRFLGHARDVARRRGRQLARAVPVALAVAVAVAVAPLPVAVLLGEERDENCFVLGGLLVQLAGFVTVWSQIRNALQSHGMPGLWTRFRAWWRSGSRRPVIHSVGAGMAMAIAMNARGRVRTGKGNYSHHARLAALEANFANLESEVDGFRQEVEKEARDIRDQMGKETQSRTSEMSELRKRLEDTAVGSADWQLVGLLWFVAGSNSSTMATQLAEWI